MHAVGPHRRARPRRRSLLLVVLLAPLVLAWVPARTVRAAGPVIDLNRAIGPFARTPGRTAERGRWLLTSVREEHDPMWLWATRSLVQPDWRGGGSAAGPLNTLAQMREAEVSAWQVAVDMATASGPLSLRGPLAVAAAGPAPAVDTEGLTGPSGGLMLALAFTDALNGGDLTGGRVVAGSGTIDRDGTVSEIGYVRYKVRGAAAAGATVFLVPSDNADEARRAAPPGMVVVAVDSFDDALRWLCGQTPADAACARLAVRQGP